MRRCLIKITRVMTILMILDWPFDSSPHDLMIVSLIETNMWYLYHIKLSITVSLLWVVLLLTTQLFEFSLVPWRFSWRAEQCHIRSWYDDNDGDYVMILMEEMMIRMMMMMVIMLIVMIVMMKMELMMMWVDRYTLRLMMDDRLKDLFLSCFLYICLSIWRLICPFVYLSIYLSIYPSSYLSIYLSIHLSIHLSIYP